MRTVLSVFLGPFCLLGEQLGVNQFRVRPKA